MKALQFINRQLCLNSIADPKAKSGQALLKVRLAGICNTDLEILRGYHDFSGTLGHEFTGDVIEAENKSLIGQRVVCDINDSCGICLMCNNGNSHHCLQRHTLGINGMDGAFAKYLVCPEDNLVVVPDHVPDQVAVFSEPVAASLQILEQLTLDTRTEIAVIGDGKLGLLICLCLVSKGHIVHLVGRHAAKLSLAEAAGAIVHQSPPAKRFPVVVEASGNPSGFEDALRLTAACGTMVMKSTYADHPVLDAAKVVVDEITLLGSRCGPMSKAVDLLARGLIDPLPLIEQEYSLEDGVQAMQHAAAKGTLKILLRPE